MLEMVAHGGGLSMAPFPSLQSLRMYTPIANGLPEFNCGKGKLCKEGEKDNRQ